MTSWSSRLREGHSIAAARRSAGGWKSHQRWETSSAHRCRDRYFFEGCTDAKDTEHDFRPRSPACWKDEGAHDVLTFESLRKTKVCCGDLGKCLLHQWALVPDISHEAAAFRPACGCNGAGTDCQTHVLACGLAQP